MCAAGNQAQPIYSTGLSSERAPRNLIVFSSGAPLGYSGAARANGVILQPAPTAIG